MSAIHELSSNPLIQVALEYARQDYDAAQKAKKEEEKWRSKKKKEFTDLIDEIVGNKERSEPIQIEIDGRQHTLVAYKDVHDWKPGVDTSWGILLEYVDEKGVDRSVEICGAGTFSDRKYGQGRFSNFRDRTASRLEIEQSINIAKQMVALKASA